MDNTNDTILDWRKIKCQSCGQHKFATGYGGETRKWHASIGCPDCSAAYSRKRYQADTEKHSSRKRELRVLNPEIYRRIGRNARKRNPGKVRAQQRAGYQRNRVIVLARMRQDRIDNPGKYQIIDMRKWRNRRARKTDAVCQHGAGCFDSAVAQQIKVCAEPGCTKRSKLDADHIMPLALGGLDCKDNLQMLCRNHNTRKADKHPNDWAKENGRLF